jgi:hypothetical protein
MSTKIVVYKKDTDGNNILDEKGKKEKDFFATSIVQAIWVVS